MTIHMTVLIPTTTVIMTKIQEMNEEDMIEIPKTEDKIKEMIEIPKNKEMIKEMIEIDKPGPPVRRRMSKFT